MVEKVEIHDRTVNEVGYPEWMLDKAFPLDTYEQDFCLSACHFLKRKDERMCTLYSEISEWYGNNRQNNNSTDNLTKYCPFPEMDNVDCEAQCMKGNLSYSLNVRLDHWDAKIIYGFEFQSSTITYAMS